MFGSDQEVAGVMAAVVRAGAEGTFGWVGSDGWSARALVAAGRERAVEGTVSVQPLARPVRGFREYFLNLTVQNNRRNPWFVGERAPAAPGWGGGGRALTAAPSAEFWEEQFRCRWEGPGAARTPYNAHARRCSGRERLSAANTELEAQLQFVADAVLALVHALRDLHAAECGAPGACPALRRAAGPALLRYLRNVRFTGERRPRPAGPRPAGPRRPPHTPPRSPSARPQVSAARSSASTRTATGPRGTTSCTSSRWSAACSAGSGWAATWTGRWSWTWTVSRGPAGRPAGGPRRPAAASGRALDASRLAFFVRRFK